MSLRSIAPALAALAVFALAGCNSSRKAPAEAAVKPDKDRKPAPAFTLKDSEGRRVSLADFQGQVVLLDFWATWCDPCKMEIPWFIDLQRKNKDRGFTVLGVSMDDDGWDAVTPFVKRLGVNYRVLMGDDFTAQLYGGVDALPTTFLIDRKGLIAAVHIGLADRKEIEDGVETLLQAPAGGGLVPAVAVGAN